MSTPGRVNGAYPCARCWQFPEAHPSMGCADYVAATPALPIVTTTEVIDTTARRDIVSINERLRAIAESVGDMGTRRMSTAQGQCYSDWHAHRCPSCLQTIGVDERTQIAERAADEWKARAEKAEAALAEAERGEVFWCNQAAGYVQRLNEMVTERDALAAKLATTEREMVLLKYYVDHGGQATLCELGYVEDLLARERMAYLGMVLAWALIVGPVPGSAESGRNGGWRETIETMRETHRRTNREILRARADVKHMAEVVTAARVYYAAKGTYMSDGANHRLGQALSVLDSRPARVTR